MVQWSKALHRSASCATRDPGSSPGSVAAGRDRETHVAAHNWPSIVMVRGGFSDSCGSPGAMHADMVARGMVFTPTHWCSWLPGEAGIVSRSSAA